MSIKQAARRPRALSIRASVSEGTMAHLDAFARQEGRTVEELASRAVEEYVRMARFPGITFTTGASGQRKARVYGGHSVWGVVLNARALDMDPERTADWLQMPVGEVRLALDYYAAYPEEIDARLRRMDEVAENPYLLHPAVQVIKVSDPADETTA